MGPFKWSRVLRKRPLVNEYLAKEPSKPQAANSSFGVLSSAVCQAANSLFVIGFLIAFPYSAFHAPSTLPGVVFIASIASLLSELCKYEFLTCRRNTSACSYICTYQNLGELPAYCVGLLQLLGRSCCISLIARAFGSVVTQILGNRLVRHHFTSQWMVAEDTIGITSQFLVGLFLLSGLKMIKSFSVAIKVTSLTAMLLFVVVVPSYFSSHEALERPTSASTIPLHNLPQKEEFLLSAALIGMSFKQENKEPALLSKSSLISAYLCVNYCVTLLVFVMMAITFYFIPANAPDFPATGSPLLETLIAITKDSHWCVAIFACFSILVTATTLIEAIQDGGRLIAKLASDGLVFKQLAAHAKWTLVLQVVVSSFIEVSVSTFQLVCIVTFVHLVPDVCIGLVVTYRRYCSAQGVRTKRQRMRGHRLRAGYEIPSERLAEESDSDDTDIDAAVDEYKTHVYVSTIMDWNGSDESDRAKPFNPADGRKIRILLLVISSTILAMSLALRWISDMNAFSISISILSLIIYFVLLSILWAKPQKPRARIATFKVPCVPWISIGSSVSSCALLFQLPSFTWALASAWIIIGLAFYATYGYSNSRLNFKVLHFKHADGRANEDGNVTTSRLRILPQMTSDISFSSIAVYPQPYSEM